MLLPSRFLRAALALVALGTVARLGAIVGAVGCGPDVTEIWICLNPITGKLDANTYDPNHYVNGVADPCHCYDSCGPQKTCPIVVDAGPLGPGCEAGAGGGGGGGGGGGTDGG
jgi:hypothetical protein